METNNIIQVELDALASVNQATPDNQPITVNATTTDFRNCIESLSGRSALLFLMLLLCGDLGFAILHCINSLILDTRNALYSVSHDGGLAEFYQYLKFIWIIVLLSLLSWKKQSLHFVAWILVFTYFLLDDSLGIHERLGRIFAANFNFTPFFGLRLQDFGELTVVALAGSVLLAPLVWSYWKGTRVFRKFSQDIMFLISILVFFGVVVDMAHSAITFNRSVQGLLGIIEDGGEMLSVSLILYYVYFRNLNDNDTNCYICDFLVNILFKRET